jgi:chromosome segregation ATPase
MLNHAFMKLDMLDLVNVSGGASSGGRNILAILAPLMTLSIIGTGAFLGILQNFQALMALMLLFILIGGFLAITGSGVFLTASGVGYAGGKAKQTYDNVFDGGAYGSIDDYIDRAKAETSEARNRAERGNRSEAHDEEADAEELVQEALNLVEQIEEEVQNNEESINKEIETAIDKIDEASNLEKESESYEQEIEKRINRINRYFHNREGIIPRLNKVHKPVEPRQRESSRGFKPLSELDSPEEKLGKGEPPFDIIDLDDGNYGLTGVKEDVDYIRRYIKKISSDLKESDAKLDDGLTDLVDAAKKGVQTHEGLRNLSEKLEELKRVSGAEEKMAKKAKFKDLYDEAIDEEKQETDVLEPRMEKLEEQDEELLQSLRKARNRINDHIKYDKKIVKRIEEESREEGNIESELQSLIKSMRDKPPINANNVISSYIEPIGTKLDNIMKYSKRLGENYTDQLENYERGVERLDKYLEEVDT